VTDPDRKLRDLLLLVAYAARRRGAEVTEVAGALGVSPAVVMRYMDELLLCGKPPFSPDDLIDIGCDSLGRIHVDLDQRLGRPTRLTVQEALALTIALHAVAAAGGEPWAETARRALDKIRARMGEDIDGRVRAVEHRIAAESAGPDVEAKLRTLERGRSEGRVVEIEYYTASRDETAWRRVRPYALVHWLGAWYVIGHDERSGERRTFKVERARQARILDERFAPPSFDARAYTARGLFAAPAVRRARVRFSLPAARYVEEEFGPEFVERQGDGALIAGLDFAHVEGLAGWVLRFGPLAEVLEPADLREAVIRRCRQALAVCG
jgi:proteasome accessory factor C